MLTLPVLLFLEPWNGIAASRVGGKIVSFTAADGSKVVL